MFRDIAGGIASALAGGAMSKLFGGGQKAGSSGIQGGGLSTDKNTLGMGDAGIKSAIQGSNVPNPDEAVPSFVSGAMAKAGKGLLEGTLQAGTSAVSDKLLDLVVFFQAEDGIRDYKVTGVQTCALPISRFCLTDCDRLRLSCNTLTRSTTFVGVCRAGALAAICLFCAFCSMISISAVRYSSR